MTTSSLGLSFLILTMNLSIYSILGSIIDTFLFFSIAFYNTGIPWVTLALGDLAVKLFVALIMLIPFRLFTNKINNFTDLKIKI